MYKKTIVNVKSTNINLLYKDFFSKFILVKFYYVNNILNLIYPEKGNLLFFSNNSNIKDNNNLVKKTLRLNRLLKYRLREKLNLKSLKNRSVNKLYVSKPEIKCSIKEVFITVYVYNREKFFILKKLSKLNTYFKYMLEINSKTIFSKRSEKINSPFKYLKKSKVYKLFNLASFYSYNLYNSNNENIEFNNMFRLFKLNSNKYILKNLKKILYMNLKKVFIYKYYLGIIYLTNYKFNSNNLTELKNKLYKIYKKKININIVNIKYIYLENTMFLDALMNKLNDRKKKALKVIRKGLSLGRIVKLHPLFYREREENNSNKEFNKVNDKLNNLLFNLENNKYINVMSRLKNKHVSGLRIEAKGRLTKRLTASRAVYKISYKGSLKNIYSSYNKLSTFVLRGLSKSNTVYVNANSKNKNGSYGMKY